MKNVILYFFIFSFIKCFAQSYKVEYLMEIENRTIQKKVELIADKDYSLTVIHYDSNFLTKYPNEYYLKLSLQDSIPVHDGDFIYFIDNKNKFILSDNFVLPKHYWVKEPITEINWKSNLPKTVKSKKNRINSKLEGSFKGRRYLVNYDKNSFAISGPLKFGGVFGLIKEIKTLDSDYLFINFKNSIKIDVDWDLVKNQLNSIKGLPVDSKQFKSLLDLELAKKINFLKSIKSPDDIGNFNYPIKIKTLEIEDYKDYNLEWDKQIERIMQIVDNENKKIKNEFKN